ncbi:uncharacterized protein [Battus philenor]|uniref:uncharacterized protein n=1 Tax=Battus philenor TaxID=42288 RepID=UPI0035CF4E06
MIRDYLTFKNQFKYLTNEGNWQPRAYFLILFEEIDESLLIDVFNDLLKYHIFDVIVLDGKNNSQVYTYDPFENYRCGKSFRRLITLGECSQANVTDFYYYKFKTGLDRCTFNAIVSDWPPYIINPKYDDSLQVMGTEQYVMKILGDLEGFQINYTYTGDAKELATVKEDMIATYPLSSIQQGYFDTIYGGLFLTYERALAFDYICFHPAFDDELIIIVKKSGLVFAWKNIYLEFTYLVWILVAITFIVYYILLVVLFRVEDKCLVMLIMWHIMLQLGCKSRYVMKVKYFFIQWQLFAFLINIYYQSNLTGLTTHSSYNYQISTVNDLHEFNIQPCISTAMKKFLKYLSHVKFSEEVDEHCDTLLSSLDSVSKDYTKYTVVLHSIYRHIPFKYADEFGEPLLYALKKPYVKVIHAVYFYKGFPMLEKLSTHTERIREGGLLDKYKRDLFHETAIKNFSFSKRFQGRFFFPSYILLGGLGLSSGVFLLELITYYIFKRK